MWQGSISASSRAKDIWILLPVFGSIVFIVMYVAATFYYPGGSSIDHQSAGFSWTQNYWCNLLNDVAINGQPNRAKPIATAGLVVLCMSITLFWILFPRFVNAGEVAGTLIRITGVLAMCSALFLLSPYNHDLITNLSSSFGVVAVAGTLFSLRKIKWLGLFRYGLFNLGLVGLNNLLYYNAELIVYLPMVQKLSFGAILLWICCINMKMYRTWKHESRVDRFGSGVVSLP